MPSLPQLDRSPTERCNELMLARVAYPWDHETFAPFPALRVEAPAETGVLNLASIAIGSFEGLPIAERPSIAFLKAKLRSSWKATREFLHRVPMDNWVVAALGLEHAIVRHVLDWQLDVVLPLLVSRERVDGPQSFELPPPDQLPAKVLRELLVVTSETLLDVDRNVASFAKLVAKVDKLTHPLLGRRMAKTMQSLRARVRAGQSARAAGKEASAAGLDDEVSMGVIVLQSALRFAAHMRGPEPAEIEHHRLIRELPDLQGPNPCDDDFAFGRLHLAGPDPVLITRVRTRDGVPTRFAVGDDHLARALRALGLPPDQIDRDLDTAITRGRLYLTDFETLADLPCQSGHPVDFFGRTLARLPRKQRYLPAPYALFHASERGLLPVAIQLGRDPETHEVFTPADEPGLWSRVKMAYLCAYLNHHEMSTHLGAVHFLLMGFVVATARQLHCRHPISVLLRHHFENVLWNDFFGHQVLVNPAGFIDQIMPGELATGSMEITRRYYQRFELRELVLPDELARRGVDDPKLLPHYPLRDDGLLLWNALHRFVSGYLAIYYPEPARDLASDHELRAWLTELGSVQGAHVAGLPARIDRLEPLADLVTGLVFRSSCFHSAVNYPQYEHFSHVDRTPASLYADVREIRTRPTGDYLVGGDPALTQIVVLHVLSSMRDKVLTNYALSWFADSRVWPLVAELRAELSRIEEAITEANRERPPYDYLRPSQVTVAANV